MSKVIIPDEVAKAIITINNFCYDQCNCEECFFWDGSDEYYNEHKARCRNTLPASNELLREKVEVYIYDRNE